MRPSLSALIIAKDEQDDLPGCLASVKDVATEIVVVVDASSIDATEAIARKAGCKVVVRAFDDYARQRQAALDACGMDWVLWIDCDERPDRPLSRAIETCLESPSHDAYVIRFSVRFLGKVLRFGGLGSEKHVRLFRREKARFIGGSLHEGLEIKGSVGGPLEGRMEHEPYKGIPEYLEKMERYTTLAAEKKLAAGRSFHVWQHLILPWEFFKRTVLRLGFLDGVPGLKYAGLSAYHHWLKYAKLRQMRGSK